MFTISVVSHGQIDLVKNLLDDLISCYYKNYFDVILTLNIPEKINFELKTYPYPITIIKNSKMLGFGANHNQAFIRSNSDKFCILNPDIRLPIDPFSNLLNHLNSNENAIIAPIVLSSSYQLEDSARKYPTLLILLRKIFSKSALGSDYEIKSLPVSVDWLAGMFLMLTSVTYKRLNGFDEKYYMYYEDVDLCFRNRLLGFNNFLTTDTYVIHDAQRQSRKNLQHLKWHLQSCIFFMFRYMLYKIK